ncbi:hypothetical protein [Streptomyces sp. McG3]|uniref:hypothetical protein n=1 Tax=Streptomyces sp. McG3 TaxID=2725483 RepID=UPI0035A93873
MASACVGERERADTDEEQDRWVRVPVGDDAARWATRVRCRRVLLVVHNVTSATRLLDVLPLFDLGVQPLATCTGSSAFRSGVAELLADTGVPVLPWEQALATPVDLAIPASFGGELSAIQGPLLILSQDHARLDARAPLRGQLDTLIDRHIPQPGPIRFTSSVPGEAAVRLRRAFY